MTDEVKVGTSALVVVTHGSRSYDCYDVQVASITKTGQIAVSYTTRDGYTVTKRFYKPKHSSRYDQFGAPSGYSYGSVDIYFGAEAEVQRERVLVWREQQNIWEALNKGFDALPTGWGRSVPSHTDIATVRQKLAVVISALNAAELYNNKQALQERSS